eukprot:363807-Chlamydomonas_euryale.AAC.3
MRPAASAGDSAAPSTTGSSHATGAALVRTQPARAPEIGGGEETRRRWRLPADGADRGYGTARQHPYVGCIDMRCAGGRATGIHRGGPGYRQERAGRGRAAPTDALPTRAAPRHAPQAPRPTFALRSTAAARRPRGAGCCMACGQTHFCPKGSCAASLSCMSPLASSRMASGGSASSTAWLGRGRGRSCIAGPPARCMHGWQS